MLGVTGHLFLAFAAALVLAPAAAPRGAGAAETVTEVVIGDEVTAQEGVRASALLLGQGRTEEAWQLLRALRQRFPDSPEVAFALGQLAVAREDYALAIDLFREILDDNPGLTRVRLDLGRAFFLKGDDENAAYHFRFALAGDLPPVVRQNVEGYMDAIRRRRRWQFSASVGIAPDSNVNAAPTIEEVTLYGLPFVLSQDARETSGIGLDFMAGGEFHHPLAENVQMRVGGQATLRDYGGESFDDTVVSGFAGPRFLPGKSSISVLASAARRWYGGSHYSDAKGIRIEFERLLTPRLSASLNAELLFVDYRDSDGLDGPVYGPTLAATYSLTPASYGRLLLGVQRQDSEVKAFANTSWQAAVGYYRDLPWGVSLYLQPEAWITTYEERLAAFGTKRRDKLGRIRVNLSKRDFAFLGFSPVVSYIFARRWSNIDLYDYDRHRFELGLRRVF